MGPLPAISPFYNKEAEARPDQCQHIDGRMKAGVPGYPVPSWSPVRPPEAPTELLLVTLPPNAPASLLSSQFALEPPSIRLGVGGFLPGDLLP